MAELVLDNGRSCTERARRFVRGCLERDRVPEEEGFDILLAVNEAVANAHNHLDRLGGEGRIVLRCTRRPGAFEVVVADCGKGFEYRAELAEIPEPTSPSGRGIFLMNELMDEVDIRPTPEGTTVRMSHRLDRAHAFST